MLRGAGSGSCTYWGPTEIAIKPTKNSTNVCKDDVASKVSRLQIGMEEVKIG